MNGPFQTERVTLGYPLLALALMTRAHDEFVGRLIGPGLLALGRLAPRAHRVTATGGTAFAAAMRVIDRVHGDAAIVRAPAEPALAAGLAEIDVAVVRVGHRAHRRQARAVHDALLARVEAQDRHALVATDQLRISAGRTGDLATFAGLQLDIVDDRADRHRRQRHRIAGLHVGAFGRDDLVAGSDALRRQDVAQLAVLVLDQRDEGGAVRIVFEPLDRPRHA